MNSKTQRSNKKTADSVLEISELEFQELKKEMKSTAMLGWIQAHQQQLIAALVVMVLVIVGISMWMQQQASMRESASVLYQKALDSKNEDRKALLDQVVREYGGTAYARFSLLLMAGLDKDHAIDHLQSLLANSGLTAELRAQGSLDLARLYMKAGKQQQALQLLSGMPVEIGYEQLRHFMMGEASEVTGKKIRHYQMALDAKSFDTKLKSEIETKLKHLRAESLTGS